MAQFAMPIIDATEFGRITVNGKEINHDILIRLDGKIEKRKKKLSKQVYGTSHTISLAEARHVYEDGMKELIIGSGQYDNVRLSDEARQFLDEMGVQYLLQPTPQAILTYNHAQGAKIGLFHVTC